LQKISFNSEIFLINKNIKIFTFGSSFFPRVFSRKNLSNTRKSSLFSFVINKKINKTKTSSEISQKIKKKQIPKKKMSYSYQIKEMEQKKIKRTKENKKNKRK
jgi:hypothetical protein